MDLRVGQKVICINARHPDLALYDEALPTEGAIYTIRAIVLWSLRGGDEDGLHLVEIVNTPRVYFTPSGRVLAELIFRVSRFRPVRETNIDVFLKMLEPAPVQEAELV